MTPGCVLAEFLGAGQPQRMPLRACCVSALLAGQGGCGPASSSPLSVVRPVVERSGGGDGVSRRVGQRGGAISVTARPGEAGSAAMQRAAERSAAERQVVDP